MSYQMSDDGLTSRSKFLTVLLILTVGIFAFSGIGMAAETQAEASNITIDNEVSDAEGEIRVLVELSDSSIDGKSVSSEVYTNQLKAHAEQSQEDVLKLTDSTDGMRVERQFWIINAVEVVIDTNRADPSEFSKISEVERISIEPTVHTPTSLESESRSSQIETDHSTVNTSANGESSNFDTTWGVERTGSPEVWNRYDNRGDGVKIAVLDTGVNSSHPDIEIEHSNWEDFVNDESSPYDDEGHGTHVSGTVVGANASGEWIGVAPDATLMHGKVLSEDGSGSGFDIIAGIEWAVEEDADVVSMSLGGQTSDFFIDAVENSNGAGTVVVASIGNRGEGTSGSPGNYYSTIGVGAIDSDDDVAYFSGGKTHHTDEDWTSAPSDWPESFVVPTVTAPGTSVKSADHEGGYAYWQGTSMAAPHVSGAIGLIIANTDDELSPSFVHGLVENTADVPDGAPDDRDTRYGSGVAHPDEALLTYLDGEPELLEIDSPAIAPRGHKVTVMANVTNTGDGRETGTLTYSFDGQVVNETSVTLEPGEQAVVPLTYEVPQEFTLKNVSTSVDYDGDQKTTDIEVVRPVSFETTSLNTSSIAETSEQYRIEAEIENTGSIEGDEDISVVLGEELGDGATSLYIDDNVTLAPGEKHVIDEEVTIPDDQPLGWQSVGVITNSSAAENDIFVTEASGTVNGSVIDAETGDPRDASTITATRDSDGATFTMSVNQTGEFTSIIAAGEYNVTADAEGFHSKTVENVTVTDNETTTETFELDPQPANVTAVVTDDTVGNPVSNATVEIIDGDPVDSIKTDEDGEASVLVERGEYDVEVRADDYATGETNLTLSAGEEITQAIALEPDDGSLNGTVVATDTSQAVDNATLTVVESGGETEWVTETDKNGTYSLTVPRHVDYTVTIDAEGYDVTTSSLDVDPGENITQNYSIEPKPATVSGLVTDAENGWTVAGADVLIADNQSYETITNDDGVYLTDVPRGSYNLTIEHPAYETATDELELARNESVNQSVELNRTPTFYVIEDLEVPETVEEETDLEARANVTNEGTENASWELQMTVNESVIATKNITVAPNTTEEFSISGGVNESPGNHSLQISTIAQEFIQDVEVESAPSAGGGGGGGGGGATGSDDESEMEIQIHDFETGTTIRLFDIPRSGSADIDTDGTVATDGISLSSIEFDFRFDPEQFRIEVTDPMSNSPVQSLPDEFGDDLAYVNFEVIGVEDSRINEAKITFDVDSDRIPEEASSEELVVYQYVDGEWVALETAGSNTVVILEDVHAAPLAIGVESTDASESDESGDDEVDEPTAETETDEDSTSESIPGFGPLVTVVGLIMCLVFARVYSTTTK